MISYFFSSQKFLKSNCDNGSSLSIVRTSFFFNFFINFSAEKFIKKLKKNDVLTIESDDPLSQFDFKNFCEEKKYEIISLKKNGNLVNIKFKIQ